MNFQPKQITQYQAEHLAELCGGIGKQAIGFLLGLISPFSDGDVIHNACGSGAVTVTMMGLSPLASIHIHAIVGYNISEC